MCEVQFLRKKEYAITIEPDVTNQIGMIKQPQQLISSNLENEWSTSSK